MSSPTCQRVRGRLVGNKVLSGYSRADLHRPRRFAGKALLYAEDPVELFRCCR